MRYFLLFLISLIVGVYADSPMDMARNKNRLYFSIDSLGHGIIIPLQINDSIIANLVFDTGGGGDIVLDSAFCAANHLAPNTHHEKRMMPYPLVKRELDIPTLRYYTSLPIKIGKTTVYYSTLDVQRLPWNRNTTIDGYFSIPPADTSHVWELNFEDNYIEVHDINHFQMPKECIMASLAKEIPYYYIHIPLQIVCNNDTLHSNYMYMMDTGNPYAEILWLSPVPEIEVLSEQEDFKLYTYMGLSSWQNTVKATAWNSLIIDTLKTHLFVVSPEYYEGFHNIGLNFLKRFNVFFDLKNWQIGLHPIAYKRIEAPNEGITYYFVDTVPTLNGHYRINYMPAFKKNYYQAAGLREGDEIVLWNGHPYSDILHGKITTDAEDSVVYHIIRDGQPMKIVVPILIDD
jgi:hypothetical protein